MAVEGRWGRADGICADHTLAILVDRVFRAPEFALEDASRAAQNRVVRALGWLVVDTAALAVVDALVANGLLV